MNVFDIMGPIMTGPSSSHTAGACRIGRVAWKILEEIPKKIEVTLSGSFSQTGRGHGTDKAIVAGCIGYHSWDERLPRALEIAEEKGIEVAFNDEDIPNSHPNTAVVHLTGTNGKEVTVQGASIGGGNIVITNVDGIQVELSGQANALIIIHLDRTGCIAACTNVMAESSVNICGFRLSRKKRGGESVMTVEIDGEIPENLPAALKAVDNVLNVVPIRML